MTLEQPEKPDEEKDPRVDEVQREVMSQISPDGTPPDLAVARAGWRRTILVGMAISVVGVLVLFLTLGPTAGGLASILFVGYVALTVPVWGAGILRGQEERIARDIAERRVHPGHRDSPSTNHPVGR